MTYMHSSVALWLENSKNIAHYSQAQASMFSFLQIEIIYEHQNWGVERSLSFSEWKHVVVLCSVRGPEYHLFNYIWSFRSAIQCIAIWLNRNGLCSPKRSLFCFFRLLTYRSDVSKLFEDLQFWKR